MKKMKLGKIILIAMIIVMLLTFGILSGCTKSKVTTLGISQIVDHPALNACRQGAIDKLAELGYVEGEDFVIDYQDSQGDPAVGSTIAQKFVSDKVDVILAISTPSAQAAYGAALEVGIPVVFSAVTDPVIAEIADKDGSPLENITGTSDEMPMDASFDLIKAIFPEATKVGILHNTSEVNSDVQLEQAREIAAANGMEVIDIGITSTNEIATALDTILPKVDVMLTLTDNMVVSAMPLMVERTIEANVPMFGSEDSQVLRGALASVGLDYYKLGLQTGAMIAKILDGTPAQDIPIERLKEFKLTINTEVAEQLGVTIPEDLLEKAEKVTTETGE